jgi:uncharacterized protein YndB with AHSA1/START domain
MPEASQQRGRTQVSTTIAAPREAIYRACLDPDALASWRVPDNMTAQVHEFEPREGGRFRMTLSYNDPQASPRGKSAEGLDTFQGRFAHLIPGQRLVEIIEFESPDPAYAGEMTMTTTLTDTRQGTEVTVVCENLPPGIGPEDNRAGTEQALRKLAALMSL